MTRAKRRCLASVLIAAVACLLALATARWLDRRAADSAPATADSSDAADRSGAAREVQRAREDAPGAARPEAPISATVAAVSRRGAPAAPVPLSSSPAVPALRAPASEELRVVVEDAAGGAPLAGAEVRASIRTRGSSETRAARSNDAGELRLTVASEPLQLRLEVPGFAAWSAALDPAHRRDVVASLVRGARLAGIVRDRDGDPVVASVRLSRLDGDRLENARTRSDRDGTFTLDGLLAGTWRLTVSAPGYLRRSADVEVPSERIDVVLPNDPGFIVRVVDTDGHAVAGAHVATRTRRVAGATPSGRTDGNGEVRLSGVDPEQPGAITLVVEHETFPLTRESVPAAALRDGGVTLTLHPSREIRGRVVSRTGDPVRGAVVRLEAGDGSTVGELRTVSSGEFLFRDLRAGRYRILVTSAAGAATSTVDLADEREDSPAVELVLDPSTLAAADTRRAGASDVERPGSISGWVLLAEPLAGARLEIRAEESESRPRVYRFSSADGRFRVRRLAPGPYTLALAREGTLLAERTGVLVRSGEETTDVVLSRGE